jgi:hypothetical protein
MISIGILSIKLVGSYPEWPQIYTVGEKTINCLRERMCHPISYK